MLEKFRKSVRKIFGKKEKKSSIQVEEPPEIKVGEIVPREKKVYRWKKCKQRCKELFSSRYCGEKEEKNEPECSTSSQLPVIYLADSANDGNGEKIKEEEEQRDVVVSIDSEINVTGLAESNDHSEDSEGFSIHWSILDSCVTESDPVEVNLFPTRTLQPMEIQETDPACLCSELEKGNITENPINVEQWIDCMPARPASPPSNRNEARAVQQDIEEEHPQSNSNELDINDFLFCNWLGQGAFGKVLLGEHKETGIKVAIKAIKVGKHQSNSELDGLMTERRVLEMAQKERSRFLIGWVGCLHTKHHVCLVMEYASLGDLRSHMKNGPLPLDRTVFYTACIVLGVQFLHDHNIVHRDLKPENLLLDETGYLQLADFGCCKEGIGFGDQMKRPYGTLQYRAPELLKKEPHTRSVDWFALGVIVHEMLFGHRPIRAKNPMANATGDIKTLLSGLMEENVSTRLGASVKGAEDIMAHSFFQTIDWLELRKGNFTPPFIPEPRATQAPMNRRFVLTSYRTRHPRLYKIRKLFVRY